MKQRIFNFALISIGIFVGTFGFNTTDANAKARTDIACIGFGEVCNIIIKIDGETVTVRNYKYKGTGTIVIEK